MNTVLLSLLTLLSPATPPCAGPHLEPAHHTHFTLCHDSTKKVPLWVAYQLTPARLQQTGSITAPASTGDPPKNPPQKLYKHSSQGTFQTFDKLFVNTVLLSLLTLLNPATPPCAGPHLEPAHHTHFTLCHDSTKKVPLWVAYQLTPSRLQQTGSIARTRFHRDPQLSKPAATDTDYRNSGYTRGHMAPAADLSFSDQARRSTFVLSNAVPQIATVNTGRWAQLERAIRRFAAINDRVLIITGPIFDATTQPESIGPNHVAVPTHIYKVILATSGEQHTMLAAIIPNTPTANQPLDSYFTTVSEVERLTGLDFFSFLQDDEEHRLENTRSHLQD